MNSTAMLPGDTVITAARIITEVMPWPLDDLPHVIVKVGTDEEHVLFWYYPDELHFTADEFVGLTLAQARHLHHRRDVEYLQS